jgi:hypothetical protein
MNPMLAHFSLAAALVLLAASPSLHAQTTLYKLVGKDGKVTYSEKPPKDFDGKVIRLDIDPKANTATLPEGSRLQERSEASKSTATRDEQLKAARARVDAAQKALEDARANPGEGDIARMGKKGGGTRPVPTEDYQQRLAKLERDLKDAEDGLQKLERGR